jgi:hypothetical protein
VEIRRIVQLKSILSCEWFSPFVLEHLALSEASEEERVDISD